MRACYAALRMQDSVNRWAEQIQRADGLTVRFLVTDTAKSIPVVYRGALPDLFREGKGVVAQGRVGTDGVFVASEVLAKHDENYMPPEAADAVKRAHETAGKAAQTLVTAPGGGPKR